MTQRTRTILKQASLGLALRVAGVVATFASMPIALSALGDSTMGVWLVLLSVFQWVTMFDLGVGAGARNEIARAAARDDLSLLHRAVSTGWYYSGAVSAGLFVVIALALLATPASDWLSRLLFAGTPVGPALWIVLAGACLSFVLNFALTVFAALEKPAASSAFTFLSNLSFLVLLVIAVKTGSPDLTVVAALYATAVLLAGSLFLVRLWHSHPGLRPTFPAIDRQLRGKILGGGLQLFVIQLCALLIFSVDRVLVSAFVGTAEVVVYDAAFRLFSLITMTHTLLMGSTWSSFTQAHARGEWTWIRKTLRRLALLTLPIAALALVMALASAPIVRVWLGAAQVGTPWLYGSFALATVLGCWCNVFSYFLNAIGDTRAQIRSALVAVLLNIPAAYFFAVVLEQGAAGVVMGTCTAMLIFTVVGPIVCRRRFSVSEAHQAEPVS
jgi:O-antigen/teichoic acid export membrane protein